MYFNRTLHKETIKFEVVVGVLFAFHVETKIGTVSPLRSRFLGHHVVSKAQSLQEEPPGQTGTTQERWQSSILPPQRGPGR
jgi:hypothetical protein